jgi:hypothetical protein
MTIAIGQLFFFASASAAAIAFFAASRPIGGPYGVVGGGAHRLPEEEVKAVGMEVQGLAIPAHGRSPGAIASSRELRRRSRARHPHFEVAQAQGFDAASTLTAIDIEGIDVAVMYGTRGRQVLSHDVSCIATWPANLSRVRFFPIRLITALGTGDNDETTAPAVADADTKVRQDDIPDDETLAGGGRLDTLQKAVGQLHLDRRGLRHGTAPSRPLRLMSG